MTTTPDTIVVTLWVNHYHCADCAESWEDTWCCACNDHCPECDAEITPEESTPIGRLHLRAGLDVCTCGSVHDGED